MNCVLRRVCKPFHQILASAISVVYVQGRHCSFGIDKNAFSGGLFVNVLENHIRGCDSDSMVAVVERASSPVSPIYPVCPNSRIFCLSDGQSIRFEIQDE